MKKTTVEWFCDKCGKQLNNNPGKFHNVIHSVHYDGTILKQSRVAIEYMEYMGVEYQQSTLCNACTIEVITEVLKDLKKKESK